jgi:hypothetical protein
VRPDLIHVLVELLAIMESAPSLKKTTTAPEPSRT